MFYLLEDNRIIETEKEYEVEYIKDTYFNSQNEYKFVYVKELHYQGLQVLRNSTTEENIGFIKKQSENVYDLIDWTKDLVGINACGEFLIINCKTARSEFNDGYYYFNWIKTIYKLDEKGNYIKVWEVKEDE